MTPERVVDLRPRTILRVLLIVLALAVTLEVIWVARFAGASLTIVLLVLGVPYAVALGLLAGILGALAAIAVAGALQLLVRDQLAVRRGVVLEPAAASPTSPGGQPFP